MNTKTQYDRFEGLVRGLLKVPHVEVKVKLDAEKRSKTRKKSKFSSVSREARDRD
jgi:hypothetical protein